MMASLDHNTKKSDRRDKLVNRTDNLMKDIAIQSPYTEHAAQKTPSNNSQIFDRSQQKLMNFKAKIPQSMIKFKNKSEQ